MLCTSTGRRLGSEHPLLPAWIYSSTTTLHPTTSDCHFFNKKLIKFPVSRRVAPRTVTDMLQRVLNAAARVVTGTWKFDRGLGQILHDKLHWLDVPDRVFFTLAVTVHRCLNGRAPPYLSDYCVPAAGVDTRQHLRSANRQLLAIPRYRLNTYGCRAFSVSCPQSGTLSRISSGTRPSVQTQTFA